MRISLQQILLASVACILVSWTDAQLRSVERPLQLFRDCPRFSYDAYYDLQNSVNTTNPYVTEQSPFTGSSCSRQGVLKLTLAAAATDPSRRRVLVDLFMDGNPTGWVFNLGDSVTNNGYAGDAGTQSYDAEVQGVGQTFNAYLSDMGGSGLAFTIPNLYLTRMTLIAGDGHITWLPENHNLVNYYSNAGLFALNGQSDSSPGGSNYDLFLGVNRVVSSGRVGSGVCRVGIKFLPEF